MNTFAFMNIPEKSSAAESILTQLLSPQGHSTHCSIEKPNSVNQSITMYSGVVAVLGDQTDMMYSFFRDGGGKDQSRTIVVGMY